MATNETRNVNINIDTNASEATKDVNKLATALDTLDNSSDSANNKTKNLGSSLETTTKGLKANSLAVLENGGAMGLLNDLTGGYAMMVKDAVEASALFLASKKASTTATKTQTGAVVAETAATSQATLATTVWNAVLALNPIGVVVAGALALAAGLTYLAVKMYDNEKALRKLNQELSANKLRQEAATRAVQEARDTMSDLNSLEVARARALGKSSDEIDNIIVKQKELAQVEAFNDAKRARREQIIAGNSLINARIVGDEDAIKAAEAQLKVATDNYQELNKNYNSAIVEAGIQRFAIQEKQRQKEADAAKKSADDANARAEVQRKEDIDNNNKKLEDQKKYYEQLAKDKAKFEADIKFAGIESAREEEEELKLMREEKLAGISAEVEAIEEGNRNLAEAEVNIAKMKAEEIAKAEQDKNEVIADSKENLNSIMASLEDAGIAKSKAGQVISKSIALAQIGIDSAVALGNATNLANKEGVAAQAAFPTVPGIGTAARILSYTTTALSVVSNISKAKRLLSSGGSGGGGGGDAGGGSRSAAAASAQPNVNFVASSENQIANGVAQQQSQTPIKAYVVPSEINTGLALERNLIDSNSL